MDSHDAATGAAAAGIRGTLRGEAPVFESPARAETAIDATPFQRAPCGPHGPRGPGLRRSSTGRLTAGSGTCGLS